VPLSEILRVLGVEWALDAVYYTRLDLPWLRLYACDCAERALLREREAGREPDLRSWTAIAVSRRYARGDATEADLRAAKIDARAAVLDARAATLSALWSAAGAAAWNAAGAAVWATARAAGDAAKDAERQWQAERLAWYLQASEEDVHASLSIHLETRRSS
jgi:hypothetical protein